MHMHMHTHTCLPNVALKASTCCPADLCQRISTYLSGMKKVAAETGEGNARQRYGGETAKHRYFRALETEPGAILYIRYALIRSS